MPSGKEEPCLTHIPQSPPFHTSPPLSKAFVGCFFVPSFRYRASGNKSSGHVTFALLSERRRSITRRGSLQGAVQAAQLHGLLPRLSGAAGSLRVKQQAALRENIPMAVVNFGIRKLRVYSSNPTPHLLLRFPMPVGTARSLGRPRRIARRPRIWTEATTDPRLSAIDFEKKISGGRLRRETPPGVSRWLGQSGAAIFALGRIHHILQLLLN